MSESLGQNAALLLMGGIFFIAIIFFLFRWIFAVEKRMKLQEEQLQVLKNIEKSLKEKDLV